MEMKIALLNDIFVSHGAHTPRSGIEYVRLPVAEPTDEGTCADETLNPGFKGLFGTFKRA